MEATGIMRKKTQLIHGGATIDQTTGAVSLPIFQASTFKQQSVGDFVYEYGRTGNPTRNGVETFIADIEQGTHGFAFASGMAAINSVMQLFHAGDHIVVTDDVYGGTYRLLTKVLSRVNVEVSFVNSANLDDVQEAIQKNTKAIFIETPTNPLLKITDIKGVATIAKQHQLLLIVDNTFSTPYWQNPLTLGADIVLHSATKYLGGHSDVIAGLVAVKDEKLAEELHFIQNGSGAILSPHDSWLLVRGMKTLGIRMEEIEQNANELANFLVKHPAVEKVYYPGLITHKGHELHKTQAAGFGGIISFTVKDEATALRVLEQTQYFTLAESLGAVESLISLPAKMTHASIPHDRRLALGIEDGLIRISVGLEDIADLIEDLTQALPQI